MIANFGQIGQLLTGLAALECLRHTPIDLYEMGNMVSRLFHDCFLTC